MMSLAEGIGIAHEVVGSILEELLDRVMAESENVIDKPTPGVHPLHSHLLLYTQVSDSR